MKYYMFFRKLCLILKVKIRQYRTVRSYNKKKLKTQILRLFSLAKYVAKKMKNRSIWVRYIFTEERRFLQGASDNLIKELEQYDVEKYINYI